MSATAYALAFGGGVVSFLSPCVLPLVPAYLSFTTALGLSEQPGGHDPPHVESGARNERPGERRSDTLATLRAAGLFIAGFSVVFMLLGLSATAVGSLLLSEHIPVTRAAGLAVMVMALVMLVSTLPLGWSPGREARFHPDLGRYGRLAAPVAGGAFAFGWTPCIGPVLGSVLAVAADQHRLAQGAVLLATYAAGLAVPFILTALAFHRSLVAFRFRRLGQP